MLRPQALARSWGGPRGLWPPRHDPPIPAPPCPVEPSLLLQPSRMALGYLGSQSPEQPSRHRDGPGPRCSATAWRNPGQPPPQGLGKGLCFHCVSPWVPGAGPEQPRAAPASCPVTRSPQAMVRTSGPKCVSHPSQGTRGTQPALIGVGQGMGLCKLSRALCSCPSLVPGVLAPSSHGGSRGKSQPAKLYKQPQLHLHQNWLQRAISTSLIINEVPIYTSSKNKLQIRLGR